jgi:hypothetical protein
LTASSSDGLAADIDIFRPNEVSQIYDFAKDQATKISNYENKIVSKYEQLDLYKSKGLTRGKISFNDLTL